MKEITAEAIVYLSKVLLDTEKYLAGVNITAAIGIRGNNCDTALAKVAYAIKPPTMIYFLTLGVSMAWRKM